MKQIFNFYIDTEVRDKVIEKIEKYNGVHNKGQLSALIRVLLKDFLNCNDEEQIRATMRKLEFEYCESTSKNKRSRL